MKDTMKNIAISRSILMTLVGAAAAASGCGTETEDITVHKAEAAITGGELVSSNLPPSPYNSAVKMGGCTATKIAPRRFLTAAHCFGSISGVKGTGFQTSIDDSLAGNAPVTHRVNKLYIHSNYDAYAGNVTYDAAVVDIASDTPTIPAIDIDTAGVPDGESLLMVGYGCDLNDMTHNGRKQLATMYTMSLAELQALFPGEVPATYNHFYPMSNGPKQICPGDSGGPAFRFLNTGEARVAGINCVGGNATFATHVDDIATWIRSSRPTVRRKSGAIITATKGTCLSAANGTTVGSPVREEPCGPVTSTNDRQYWNISPISGGELNEYRIRNGKTGLCLVIGSNGLAQQGLCPTTGWLIPQVFGTPTSITSRLTNFKLGSLFGDRADAAFAEGNDRQTWLVFR